MTFFIAEISSKDLSEQERLPSLRYTWVTISCLTHRCFHSHWYFIVPLRDTRLTILTSKELRYNLLTFSIFIIQLQVGAIHVFSRQCNRIEPPCLFCTLTLLKLALCSHSDLARSKALWSFLKSSMVIFFNQQESLWIFPHSTLINSIWYDQTWSNHNFQPIRIKTIRHRALTALDLKCCMGGKLQSIIQFKICLLSF